MAPGRRERNGGAVCPICNKFKSADPIDMSNHLDDCLNVAANESDAGGKEVTTTATTTTTVATTSTAITPTAATATVASESRVGDFEVTTRSFVRSFVQSWISGARR